MKLKSNNLKKILHLSLLLAVFAVISQIGFCSESSEQTTTMKLGGLRETAPNSLDIEGFGRFAVEEHNKKENTLLEFTRIVKAKQQVVSGMMYHLTLEAKDGGQNKMYEAKVWVKPGMNFKQLEEFKEVHDNPMMSSTLG